MVSPARPWDIAQLPAPAVVVGPDGTVRQTNTDLVVVGEVLADLPVPIPAGVSTVVGSWPGLERVSTGVAPPPPRSIELRIGDDLGDGSRLVLLRDISDAVLYERLAFHAADSILVLDDTGELKRRIWGRLDDATDDEVMGDNMLSRLHPEDLASVLESVPWLSGAPGRRLRTTIRARRHQDASRWQFLALDAVAALDDPVLAGYVAFTNLLADDVPTTGFSRFVGTSLTDAVPIGVIVADRPGRAVFQNRLAIRILGRDPDVIDDDPWFTFLPAASRAGAVALHAEAFGADTSSPAVAIVPLGEDPGGPQLRLVACGATLAQGAAPMVVVTLEAIDAGQPGQPGQAGQAGQPGQPTGRAATASVSSASVEVLVDTDTGLGSHAAAFERFRSMRGAGLDVAVVAVVVDVASDGADDPIDRRAARTVAELLRGFDGPYASGGGWFRLAPEVFAAVGTPETMPAIDAVLDGCSAIGVVARVDDVTERFR